jgi:hypothetical protein
MRVDSVECEGDSYRTVEASTEDVFALLLQPGYDDPHNPKPLLKDVQLYFTHVCHESDQDRFELGLINGKDSTCWKHVHPQHLNIYDVTYLINNQTNAENITEWAENDEAILRFPGDTFDNQWFFDHVHNHRHVLYPLIGKLGDVEPYEDLREELQSEEVADKFGEITVNPGGKGVVVCGSLGEVANDPSLGSGFDINRFGTKLDSRRNGVEFSSDATGIDFFNGQR